MSETIYDLWEMNILTAPQGQPKGFHFSFGYSDAYLRDTIRGMYGLRENGEHHIWQKERVTAEKVNNRE